MAIKKVSLNHIIPAAVLEILFRGYVVKLIGGNYDVIACISSCTIAV